MCDIDSCVQGSCAVDVDGHGSHCAGTIAGTTYGVAKAATVVAVKVLGDDGGGTWAGIVAGMDWVRAQKVADPSTIMVVSMSLGGAGQSSASATAIDALWGAGVVTSVAAGNDNSDACNYSPAFVPNAITVGSTTSSDARSSFSNCKGRSMHRNCQYSTPAVACTAQLCNYRHSDVAHPSRATAAELLDPSQTARVSTSTALGPPSRRSVLPRTRAPPSSLAPRWPALTLAAFSR